MKHLTIHFFIIFILRIFSHYFPSFFWLQLLHNMCCDLFKRTLYIQHHVLGRKGKLTDLYIIFVNTHHHNVILTLERFPKLSHSPFSSGVE